MSEIKQFKDGSYEIQQVFVDIIHFPLQVLLDIKGHNFTLDSKITRAGQDRLASFLTSLGREEGFMYAEVYKVLQVAAWEHVHKNFNLDRVPHRLDMDRQRIIRIENDEHDECEHSDDEHDAQVRKFVGGILDQVADQLRRESNRKRGHEPDIFDKINKTIFKKKD